MENSLKGMMIYRVTLGIVIYLMCWSAWGQDISPINCSIKSYKGYIDNKHLVTAQITIRKEEISTHKYYQKVYGYFYYDTTKLSNKFLGFATKDSIDFHIYNDNGKVTEQFIGKFSEDSIKGLWTMNGKSLPFYLAPITDYEQKHILCAIPFSFSKEPCPRLDTQNEYNIFMASSDDKIILNIGNSKQLKIFDVHSLTFEKVIDIDCFVNKLYVWGKSVIVVSLTDIECLNVETGAIQWSEKLPFIWYYDILLNEDRLYFYNITNEGNRELFCFDLASRTFDNSSKDDTYILTDKNIAYLTEDGKTMLSINISGDKDTPNSYNTPKILPVDSLNAFSFLSEYGNWITIANSHLDIIWNFETTFDYQASIIKNEYLLLYGPNTKLYDLKSHELLWAIEQPLTPNFILEGDILYFISNEVATAVDISSGNILWYLEVKGGREVVEAGNMIFLVNSSILEPLSMLTGIQRIEKKFR